MIELILPYPPSANRYWRVRAMGKVAVVYKSAEARKYLEAVAEWLKRKKITPLTGPVGVDIVVYRPRKDRDLDNCIKVVLDSMNKRVYVDDKQIETIYAERCDDKLNPRVEVKVYPL